MNKSLCCNGSVAPYLSTDTIVVTRCGVCGSLFVRHVVRASSNPWHDEVVSVQFLGALLRRRLAQAKIIIEQMGGILRQGPVLDYGCGQGAFVSVARQAGVDCMGADVFTLDKSLFSNDCFIQLQAPWQLPDTPVNALVLLDVIEHHEAPDQFFRELRAKGVRFVIIKTPMLGGPIAMVARTAAMIGRPALLERLLLVGQSLPHQSYLSRAGLVQIAHNAGYRVISERALADVGQELPDRMRLPGRALGLRFLARHAGVVVEYVSRVWSDSRVFVFELDETL